MAARLFERGWVAPGWPKAHGGCEWTPTQRFIYDSERSAIGAPEVLPFGIKMVGPVIFKYGNEEQKARFLPRILRGEDWWCQGYSEPGAGSDLAALKTRAERAGDHYIVNGSKIWTTYAQHADWMFCLVRTEACGTAAGRHQLPADRHEDAGHPRQPDHLDRRRAQPQRGVLRQRARAGGQPDRRAGQGLDLRQVAARRTSAPPSPASAIPSAASSGCANWRAAKPARHAAARRPAVPGPAGRHRDRADGAGDDGTARAVRGLQGQGPGRRKLAAEDQGQRSAAGHPAADDGHGRPVRLRCWATAATTSATRPGAPSCTAAPPPSTAARTRCRRTSRPRPYWGCRSAR